MVKKQKLTTELNYSREEIAFQKEEKGKRAAELDIDNKELEFRNEEKEKCDQCQRH